MQIKNLGYSVYDDEGNLGPRTEIQLDNLEDTEYWNVVIEGGADYSISFGGLLILELSSSTVTSCNEDGVMYSAIEFDSDKGDYYACEEVLMSPIVA